MKKLISTLLVAAMTMSLVACGAPKNPTSTEAPAATETTDAATTEKPEVQDVTLKVWAPEVDQKDEGTSWIYVMCDQFEAAHPEYNVTWEIGVCGEGDAATHVKTDPAAAADVYFYANDQMGTLVEAGALAKLGGSYLEGVKATFPQTHVDLLTYTDGEVYGFPTSPNTWFLWYNNEVFTEEDVKSLDTMLEKGVVSFPMDNSWYTASFLFAAGGTAFGTLGNDAAAGVQFASDECVEAAKYMAELNNNPNFVNDDGSSGVAGMNEGTVHAVFTGDWSEKDMRPTMGDKLSCTVLPKFTANGTEYQMKSFAGNKAVGVNPNCANPKAAMEFAAFITSPEALASRYELSGYTPAVVADGADVSATAVVLSEQMADCAVPQPVIAEMNGYWDPVKNFGLNILNDSITADNAKENLEKTMELINSAGL